MKLNVLRADPAGNITLFVLDPIERERRAALAAELMRRLPDMKIDQVGFACPADADTDGRMEMMGGEFCGNATRAFASTRLRCAGGAKRGSPYWSAARGNPCPWQSICGRTALMRKCLCRMRLNGFQ